MTEDRFTRVLQFDDAALREAARFITSGDVVAVPTETVYGLAADATSGAAVARIYQAKQRPGFNPLIVHVADLAQARAIGEIGSIAQSLVEEFWPGPLTLVVPLRVDAAIANAATAGLTTVALRMSSHRAMQALLHATGKPLAAPSANISGALSPTRAAHVLQSLGGRIPLIVDDGATQGGIESTIVAVDGGAIRLLRAGPVEVAGSVVVTDGAIEAPGQLAAHYAPTKPLRLDAAVADPNEWMIGFGAVAGDATLSATGDLREAGARLFDLLHRADASDRAKIAVASIPEYGIGNAINDRLRRAALGAAAAIA